jgi:hypothetical protein
MANADVRTKSKTSAYVFIGLAVGMIVAVVAALWYVFTGAA